MLKKSIVGMAVYFFAMMGGAWAQTYHVLDTGDPAERVCNPKSYTDLGNGIVRDNVTGLEWMQDGNVMASRDPAFDSDDTAGDGKVTWQHALDYIELLNTDEYLGYDDWRLPTIEELSTLVDVGRLYPSINIAFFPYTVASNYWSSTTGADSTDLAWNVYFFNGYVGYYHKSSNYYVRAVRGGAFRSFDPFTINGDGTVTDPNTGLIWQQCNYGQTWDGSACSGNPASRTWQQAKEFAQGLNTRNYLGYSDWRLPTRNELQSLVDYSLYSRATTFPDMPEDMYYWSSTTTPPDSGIFSNHAYQVEFESGYSDLGNKNSGAYMRAVRGGPCGSLDEEWDLDGDGGIDKDDFMLLKLRQKAEKSALLNRHKAEKTAMKAALQ